MSGLDLIALGVLVYNTLRGLATGLVRTACGLAAIAAATVVATQHPEWGRPLVDPFFEPGGLVSGLMQPAAIWMATFLTVNGLGVLLRMALHKTFLKHVDQLGGAAFGLAAGAVLLAAPLVVINSLPLLKDVRPLQNELSKSIVVTALNPVANLLEPVASPRRPPAVPAKAVQPAKPGQPANAGQPTKAVQPAKPGKPKKAVQPAKPGQPIKPAKPAKPANPMKPAEPARQ